MTTQELKNKIEKVLGNSIRCLIPSYWWKNLFHSVADRIDDVEQSTSKLIKSKVEEVKMPIVESVDELENLKLAKGRVAAVEKVGEPVIVNYEDCYISLDYVNDWDKYTIVRGVSEIGEVPFDAEGGGFQLIADKYDLYADTITFGIEGGRRKYGKHLGGGFSYTTLNKVNEYLASGRYRLVGGYLSDRIAQYFTFYSAVPQTSLYIKGDSWERLVKERDLEGIGGGTINADGVEIRELHISQLEENDTITQENQLTDEQKAYNLETLELARQNKAIAFVSILNTRFLLYEYSGKNFTGSVLINTSHTLELYVTVSIDDQGNSLMKLLSGFKDDELSDTSENVVQNKVIKKYIDDAIANVGGGGGLATMMIETTYAELVTLRDNGNLIPGMRYRITDYETETAIANTQSAHHPFDIIVTAIEKNALSENAEACVSDRDTDGYFADSNIEAWRLKYCLDNDPYKGIIVSPGGMSYNINSGGEVFTLPSLTTQEYIYNGQTYYIILELEEMFGEGAHFLIEKQTPDVNDAIYIIAPSEGITEPMEFGYIDSVMETIAGKGVIYEMIDDKNNIASYDFKNIMFLRKLTNGIIDLDNGIDVYCYTFSSYDNGEIKDTSLLLYDVYNNKLSHNVLDVVMISTSDNICYNNMFGEYCNAITLGERCFNNIFGDSCTDVILKSNNDSNVFGSGCWSNVLEDYSSYNKLGDYSYGNHINGSYNVFGNECQNNKISATNTVFGNQCSFIEVNNCSLVQCEFANGAGSILITDTSNRNNQLLYIKFGFGCTDIICNKEVNKNAEYFEILSGVKGEDTDNRLELQLIRGNDKGVKTIAKNSAGEIKTYCVADLIQ